MKFTPLIRDARRRAGMSQDELAQAAKVSRNALWLAEQGSGTLSTLIPIMGILQIVITGLPPGPDLGSRVRAARHKRRWSLQELASRSGVSIPTVRGLEQSRGRIASLEAVISTLAPTARERRPSKVRRAPSAQDGSMPAVQRVIHGDCTEVMPALEAGSVNLVVTSPPYNAEKPYEPVLSVEDYTAFAERWVSCIPRLLSPSGALWLNVGYTKVSNTETMPLTYLYYPILKRHGLHLIQEIVWHYEGGLSYTKRFSHRSERWMWWVKDPTNYVFHLDEVRDGTLNRTLDRRNNVAGKNPGDVWYYDRVVGGKGAGKEKTLHPAQFPVEMVARVVRACSNLGDIVLDCFGGSGSTAEAAGRNGRSFISIERDARYDTVARERLARVTGRNVAAE